VTHNRKYSRINFVFIKRAANLNYSEDKVPVGERKSYSGTVKAGSEPRPISETTDAMTALRITIGVELERGEESADEGHKTDSTAKKHPATAALKPKIQGNYLKI
jgi:hypothetical protein